MRRLPPGVSIRRVAPGVHWDGRNRTLYLQERFSPGDLPDQIAAHRQTLEASPEDVGTRFMLANCLYASGQPAEAEAEWERVVRTGGAAWSETVAQARQTVRREPDDPAV